MAFARTVPQGGWGLSQAIQFSGPLGDFVSYIIYFNKYFSALRRQSELCGLQPTTLTNVLGICFVFQDKQPM